MCTSPSKYSLTSGILVTALLSAAVQATQTAHADLSAQLWKAGNESASGAAAARLGTQIAKGRVCTLNHAALAQLLASCPNEFTVDTRRGGAAIILPMPDGSFSRFSIVESQIMAPELAARFPRIKTYLGQGIDDPAATARLDFTPAGFHAQVLSPNGVVYVEPHPSQIAGRATRPFNSNAAEMPALLYLTYHANEIGAYHDGGCETGTAHETATQVAAQLQRMALTPAANSHANLSIGPELRTYRLAVAAQGEYTALHGGTVEGGLAAIVTTINRVNGIYETELGIRLQLVANNDLLIYTNALTDPYTFNDPSATTHEENQTIIDEVIGAANYDLGHLLNVFHLGASWIGAVCVDGSKARGISGQSLQLETVDAPRVMHEMGHQFGAVHTWNGNIEGSACSPGNYFPASAYEPGSGTTIMSYAGINCLADNVQNTRDPYFHSASFEEIISTITMEASSGCATVTPTGNHAPVVSAGLNFSIPARTPFTLAATGSDSDGDTVTYCWEERDLGPARALADADNGRSPLFRSFPPTLNPSRTFPQWSDILNNRQTPGERLPTRGRTMRFRVTARDNRAGSGGVSSGDMELTVIPTAAPFAVTLPDSAVIWSGTQNVTWDVAGTTEAPISVATVNILLSTNGALDFPIVLAANTPNDGSETVHLPDLYTSQARVKVEAVSNVFFNVSQTNFTLVPSAAPVLLADGAALFVEGCLPPNGVIDPGETVSVKFAVRNTGAASTTNLVATLLPTGGVMAPGAPQTLGGLAANGEAATNLFSFTADPSLACGSTLRAVLQLQDGARDLGTFTFTFQLGQTELTTLSFTNKTSIQLGNGVEGVVGPGNPYPSDITVSGIAGSVSKVTVTLMDLNRDRSDDLDFLLVGPGGQSVALMSDAGGAYGLSGVTLTFDDAASAPLSELGPISSGTYKPTNFYFDDVFDTPAPSGSYSKELEVFNGAGPNGTWKLFGMFDYPVGASGSLSGGWRLAISKAETKCCGQSRPGVAINQILLEGGLVRLRFSTVAGERYQLERADELANSTLWKPVVGAEDIAGNGEVMEAMDAGGASEPRRFYRVATK